MQFVLSKKKILRIIVRNLMTFQSMTWFYVYTFVGENPLIAGPLYLCEPVIYPYNLFIHVISYNSMVRKDTQHTWSWLRFNASISLAHFPSNTIRIVAVHFIWPCISSFDNIICKLTSRTLTALLYEFDFWILRYVLSNKFVRTKFIFYCLNQYHGLNVSFIQWPNNQC
jgi:hypothetical protein